MLTGSFKKERGFTLIELLVVLAIIALLASLVVPALSSSLSRSKESALKHDLTTLRKAIDDYYSDKNEYPSDLQNLVDEKMIRYIPKDPLTGRNDSWITIQDEKNGGISDIKSGAEGISSEGDKYEDW